MMPKRIDAYPLWTIMADSNSVRWTITVSRETDLSLRRYLGIHGMKKGDLSRFVEEAVRWRVLDRTVEAIRLDNEEMSAEAVEDLIGEALEEVRAERRERKVLGAR